MSWLWGFAAGIGCGGFYFGGLWLTVKRLGKARRGTLSLFASFLVRISLTCVVFFFFMREGWADLVACLLGFFLTRFFWIQRLRPGSPQPGSVHRSSGGAAPAGPEG
jgi:F1F0 ATPase subunit 2